MAEIAGSTVFINDVVSYNTPDLLQQAFQEVVDQNDHDNEFVTFLAADDEDSSQTIHLTHAQASALRLTFQVDSTMVDEDTAIVSHENPDDTLIEMHHDIKNNKSIELNQSMDLMELASDTQWTIDDVEDTKVKSLSPAKLDNHIAERSTDDLKNNSQSRNVTSVLGARSNFNGLRSNHNSIATTFSSCGTSRVHTDTLPNRMPTVFPSPQFIIKPAKTLLKSGKNIRLIPNANTIGNVNTNKSASNLTCNITSQNSVLLPRTTLMTSMAPQMLKTSSIAPQLIHGNAISARLLDPSQISTCDVLHNSNVTNCNSTEFAVNNRIRSSQNSGKNTSLKSPTIASSSSMEIQRDNTEPSIMSVPKSTCESPSTVKSYGSSETTGFAGTLFRSLQIPTQLMKTSSLTTGNSSTLLNSKKNSVTHPPQMILKTGAQLKTQQFKKLPTPTSTAIHHRVPTQSISTPVSILKPQTKLTNTVKSTSIINSRNNTSLNHDYTSAANQVPKTIRNNQILNNHILKLTTTNDSKIRLGELPTHPTGRIMKRPKTIGAPQNSSNLALNDAGKPLGSSENPIQIIQQGHTFHSMQKLTQSQLKQIAHVLQQRSQESADPNERVVYRVVFPEDLDLRIRNPINLIKGRAGKRGRPKKKPSTVTKSSTHEDDIAEDIKDERKKPVARTRSGRLSRPPRHIVRDYKHLHHLDLLQPDLDDSDGGYSDYVVSNEKLETDDVTKDLLTGYEGPKRKISDHFRCPTCNKIYLGRTRMAKHFEIHPDHGNTDQLPPRTVEPDLKNNTFPTDTFKRKGKKRGPWAYITPEAKSERRQAKLKEALSACDSGEIVKIAAKPLLDAQSLFDLMVLKSENSLELFLNELKILLKKTREQVKVMLTPVHNEEKYENTIKLDDKSVCDTLGLSAGLYHIKDDAFNKSTDFYNASTMTTSLSSSSSSTSSVSSAAEEPPAKVLKVNDDTREESIKERLSNELSETSDTNIRSNFLTERNLDSNNANCPDVLTALTLVPRASNLITTEVSKSNNVSKLLISNTEIQSQISDNPGFQKIDINSSQNSSFKKMIGMDHGLDISNFTTSVFPKLEENYEQSKVESSTPTFIKLEPMQQGFVKLKNGNVDTYHKEELQIFQKPQDSFDNISEATQTFTKGFQKLISKIIPVSHTDSDCIDAKVCIATTKDEQKSSHDMSVIQNAVPIMTTTCDNSNIFGSTGNLDISKMTNYDLDILSNGEVIDKHLIIDEKLVEQLHLVDQSNLVDELVSERLKNIMPDNILDTNLMTNNPNLDTELDFEALSEEFNRNTRS